MSDMIVLTALADALDAASLSLRSSASSRNPSAEATGPYAGDGRLVRACSTYRLLGCHEMQVIGVLQESGTDGTDMLAIARTIECEPVDVRRTLRELTSLGLVEMDSHRNARYVLTMFLPDETAEIRLAWRRRGVH